MNDPEAIMLDALPGNTLIVHRKALRPSRDFARRRRPLRGRSPEVFALLQKILGTWLWRQASSLPGGGGAASRSASRCGW